MNERRFTRAGIDPTRRRLGRALTASFGLAALLPGLAQALVTTPRQSRGPFYPERLPLDADNDLVQVAGQPRPARGEIIHVSGQVQLADGTAVEGARVEIWQCDAFGRYHHSRDDRGIEPDPGFQGFGHAITDAQGGYRFRTINPVAYPGRAPHIHFAVRWRGREVLVTQMYVAGAPENAGDFLLSRVHDPAQRQALIVDLQPAAAFDGQKHGRFDLVLG